MRARGVIRRLEEGLGGEEAKGTRKGLTLKE